MHHVALLCESLETSLAFYRDILGAAMLTIHAAHLVNPSTQALKSTPTAQMASCPTEVPGCGLALR